MTDIDRYSHDVVVIGAGGSGRRAALLPQADGPGRAGGRPWRAARCRLIPAFLPGGQEPEQFQDEVDAIAELQPGEPGRGGLVGGRVPAAGTRPEDLL